MTVNAYSATVPAFVQILNALSSILSKAAAHAEAKKIDPSVFVTARIAPDMFPLARQVQIATDHAKGAAARMAGIDVPSFADTETTIAELQARIAKTLDFVKGLKPAQFDGGFDRDVTLTIGGQKMTWKGDVYLHQFALPNFYFHVTAAYAILRHNGVEVGKRDFLGTL
jgi:hypothetical protein